jgi:microcompartment protein CcmK/EutM
MEGSIQFISNYEDWKAIKKIKVTEQTNPRTVAEFLACLSTSLDAKVESNLRKIVALDKLDAAVKELGFGKGDSARALEEINSRKISAVINEIIELPNLQANEKKELQQFCRVYATRKALKECGLMVDYSEIDIPGMKRLKKKKVE